MWQIIPGQDLHYREWDDEFVLYNNLSGDTHLLGISAICLLRALQTGPTSDDALTTSLCNSFDMERDGEVEKEVHTLLENLQSLSLIETVS
jgi:PqqD family protein of HPr-rel-A system